MKKVLIMAKSFGGGGTEVAMIELLNRMPEGNFDVTVAVLDDVDREYLYRLKRKIKIVPIRFKNKLYRNMVSMDSLLAKAAKRLCLNAYIPYYTWLFDAVENVFDEEYDLALDFYGYGYFLTGYIAERIRAKKKATWIHAEIFGWFKNVCRYAERFDRIFAVSKATKEKFCLAFPAIRDKAEVFYNMIDTEEIWKKSLLPGDILKGKFIILSVGRLCKDKGFDLAVEAAQIMKEKKLDFCWYIIGEGRQRKQLERRILSYGLQNCFQLLGRKDNPYTYMRQCDLYVQPSRNEGYGVTLLEARVLCLPILASDIPSNREQLLGGCGYLVSLHAEEIAAKIEELQRNSELLRAVRGNLKENRPDFSGEFRKLDME